jgi:nicotinate-nucleotide adenylyltransferase
MRPRGRLGILGGTFDPLHCGHLDAARAARAAFALDHLWLLPSRVPPHRPQPVASAYHRFAMAALAVAGEAGCQVSDLELERDGTTFTIDTLKALHERGWSASQIFFIIGTDAFAEIATWHRYPEVLDAAHFVIVARPGTTLDSAVARSRELEDRFVGLDAARDASSRRPGIFLLPAATRDVSSTRVRARLALGDSIAGMVPDVVGHHILAHHLYQAVDNLHGQGTSTKG